VGQFPLLVDTTGDFSEALQSLTGGPVDAVSATTIVRLKETWAHDYDAWNKRDLSSKQYAYIWADGIHVNVRLEDEGNQRQCILVLMGATADGEKELIAVRDGFRESEASWWSLGATERCELACAVLSTVAIPTTSLRRQ
jgi:putative transposase